MNSLLIRIFYFNSGFQGIVSRRDFSFLIWGFKKNKKMLVFDMYNSIITYGMLLLFNLYYRFIYLFVHSSIYLFMRSFSCRKLPGRIVPPTAYKMAADETEEQRRIQKQNIF